MKRWSSSAEMRRGDMLRESRYICTHIHDHLWLIVVDKYFLAAFINSKVERGQEMIWRIISGLKM